MKKPEISIEYACKNALQVIENNNISQIYLAYSGGLDSSVLVHGFNQLLSGDTNLAARPEVVSKRATHKIKAVALHVNHGLQREADSWQQHCERTCKVLGLEFHSVKLQLDEQQLKSSGVEATAREARYKWLFEWMQPENSALLTAHHQGDQAETVLLNLIRGSGVSGLAGIREQTERDGVTLMRPFLTVSRETIDRYARQYQLEWIEDPSNSSNEFLRNRVRHDFLPLIENIRAGSSKNLVRLANNMQDVDGLLEELAVSDLGENIDSASNPLDGSYCLSIDKVRGLSEARIINTIRYWLKVLDFQSPSRSVLKELARWCRGNSNEKLAHQLSHGWFYGYRGSLYYVPNSEQDWLKTGQWINLSKPWLMRGGRQLRARSDAQSGLGVKKLEIVKLSRQDKCTCSDGSTRSLAKLVQDHGIPLWRRSKLWGIKSETGIIWVAGVTNLRSANDFCLEYES